MSPFTIFFALYFCFVWSLGALIILVALTMNSSRISRKVDEDD